MALVPFLFSNMRPCIALLSLMSISVALFTSAAGREGQDAEGCPGIVPRLDIYVKSAEFLCVSRRCTRAFQSNNSGTLASLAPTNLSDSNQESSFGSNPSGKILTKNSGGVQHGHQASIYSLDSGHGLFQPNVEALLFEEAGKFIRSFEAAIDTTTALGMALYDALESASFDSTHSSDAPFTPLLKKAAKFIAVARDDFRAKFPFPATAPGHVERVGSVSEALDHFQQTLIRLGGKHGIEQRVVERYLTHVKPFLHEVAVLIGDVTELYPAVIEALVLNLSDVLLPEAAFLRSLMILYCFGPYVLGQDAISGWLLKHVSEALRGVK